MRPCSGVMVEGESSYTSVYISGGAAYEFAPDHLRVSTEHDQQTVPFAEITSVNLRYRGFDRHVCTVRLGRKRRLRITGTTNLAGSYAEVVTELHDHLKPHAGHVRFTAGSVSRFALGACALLAIAGIGLQTVIDLRTFMPTMIGGGWSLGVVFIFGAYVAGGILAFTRRNRPCRYRPYEGEYPYFAEADLLYNRVVTRRRRAGE